MGQWSWSFSRRGGDSCNLDPGAIPACPLTAPNYNHNYHNSNRHDQTLHTRTIGRPHAFLRLYRYNLSMDHTLHRGGIQS
jgi:hypothetical protein